MKKLFKITILCTLCTIVQVQVRGQIIHVPDDQQTIQAGIDAANNGDTVLVEDDTYFENINFMGKAITVASQFLLDGDTNHIHNTIIDGSQPVNPDLGSVVTFITGEDTTSIICGFTITGGSGMYSSLLDARIGGGIVCFYAGAKIISNKIIDNEVSASYQAAGGGIGCFYDIGEQWVIVDNNIVIQNECYTTNDLALGGGIYVACNAIIKNNSVINNLCSSELFNGEGGGIATCNLFGDPDSVNIINNTIKYNSAFGYNRARGGGVTSISSHACFRNNTISYNEIYGNRFQGGGISIVEGVTTYILDNILSYNTINVNSDETFWGPGVYCYKPTGKTIILNNEFSNNSGPSTGAGAGGGLCIYEAFENEVVVDANKFLNNNAYHGGGFYEKNSFNILLSNNIFLENTANERGGGIGMTHPDGALYADQENPDDYGPQIINNTFYSNSAINDGGALRFNGTGKPPIIFNCIFWMNEAQDGKDIKNLTNLTMAVYYSDIDTNNIMGFWTGEKNINVDPLFVGGDSLCHLTLDSPCIKNGTDVLIIDDIEYFCPTTDYDGENRPDTCAMIPDIGADEVMYDCVNISEHQASDFNIQVFPNPCSGSAHLVISNIEQRYVTVEVFTLDGLRIRRLLDQKVLPGEYKTEVDVKDLPAGVYFVRLQAGNHSESIKLILTH